MVSPDISPDPSRLVPESNQSKEESMFVDILQAEISGLGDRERAYLSTALQADLVFVMHGCDDSRQGIPQGMQDIEWMGEQKRVLFDFVPAIGGGVSKKVLPAVVDRLISAGVEAHKIIVGVTQHGNSEEVEAAVAGRSLDVPTCGLRGVLKKLENNEKVDVLPGLLTHAGETNKSPRIVENGTFVFEQTRSLLTSRGVAVVGGYFDHEGDDSQGKIIYLTQGLETPTNISLPAQASWHEKHQDPKALVVSVGPRAATLPDGVVMPHTVGEGANNDFNSAGIDKDSFFRAMREQWYALSHIGGHGEDVNFAHSELMVLICDGAEQVRWVNEFMKSNEFKNEFAPFVKKLKDAGLHVVDLSRGSVQLLSA